MSEGAPKPRRRKAIDEAWSDVAARLGGTVVERRGVVKSIEVPHRGWTLKAERFSGDGSTMWTRVSVRFPVRMPLRMTIVRETPIHRLGIALGMQDITAGDRAFDRAFNIRADSESMARSLLLNRAITGPLLKDRAARLELRPKRGARDAAELRYTTSLAKDSARLVAILDLVRSVLDGLERVGVARNGTV